MEQPIARQLPARRVVEGEIVRPFGERLSLAITIITTATDQDAWAKAKASIGALARTIGVVCPMVPGEQDEEFIDLHPH